MMKNLFTILTLLVGNSRKSRMMSTTKRILITSILKSCNLHQLHRLIPTLPTLFQCPQASRQYSIVRRSFGLSETHWLLAEITIRWWPSRPCQEEEHEEGTRWRCRSWRRRWWVSWTLTAVAIEFRINNRVLDSLLVIAWKKNIQNNKKNTKKKFALEILRTLLVFFLQIFTFYAALIGFVQSVLRASPELNNCFGNVREGVSARKTGVETLEDENSKRFRV